MDFLNRISVFIFFQQTLYFDNVTTVIGGEREKNYWISHNSNPPFTIFCFNHQRFFDILLINVENNWIAQKIHIYITQYCHWSKVNLVQEPCTKCFGVHLLEFKILANHIKHKTQNIKVINSFGASFLYWVDFTICILYKYLSR
mgnify:CR=1 FL=1